MKNTLIILVLSFSVIHAKTIKVPDEYRTIQEAINAVSSGDTVLVAPGTYTEAISFLGKDIYLKSTDGPLHTIITDADSVDIVDFSQNETNAAIIEGFTIQGGHIGIWCKNASPTIRGNLLRDQSVTNYAALVVSEMVYASIGSSTAIIENNTIANCPNGGIAAWSTNVIIIRNNIIANNGNYGIHRQPGTLSKPGNYPIVEYNIFFGNLTNFQNIKPGIGCLIDVDPLFNPDYSLNVQSPCINAGNPNSLFNNSDGSINDIGAIPFKKAKKNSSLK